MWVGSYAQNHNLNLFSSQIRIQRENDKETLQNKVLKLQLTNIIVGVYKYKIIK